MLDILIRDSEKMKYAKIKNGYVHLRHSGVWASEYRIHPDFGEYCICGRFTPEKSSPQGVVTCPDCIAIIKDLREAKIEGEPDPQEIEDILREAADNWLDHLKISYGSHPKFAREIKEIEDAIQVIKSK